MALGLPTPGHFIGSLVPALEYYSDGPLQLTAVQGTPASTPLQ